MEQSYKDILNKLSFKERFIVNVILWAIKNHKMLWLATQVAQYIGAHLHIDKQTKTWSFTSDPAFNPENQNINFDDIAAIFKSHPENYKVTEERTSGNTFKSFTVQT